ncbi:PKD domain-containing protein [Hymenobacter negativus]|uniref:PKD domain-containing protein n=1 Tax=Hymenobacter negativus TaxID=2795026 RepID=A0ABS0QC21_9BACT|nr:PKD domain-containing protein [Hymenobacter negativus]MBH8559893.1 PKD domain-containing protein [Hymenobacter negativus]
MKINFLFIAACTALTVAACKKDNSSPQAAEKLILKAGFTLPAASQTGSAVVFTNTSQNATRYVWRFGDGTTDATPNPGHTYYRAGTYGVTLLAYNAESAVDSVTQSLNVAFAPINKTYNAKGTRTNVSMTYSPSGQIGYTTSYEALPFMSLNIIQTTANSLTINGYSGTFRSAYSNHTSYMVNMPKFPNPGIYSSLDNTILDMYPQGDSIVLTQTSHAGASYGYRCTDIYRSK